MDDYISRDEAIRIANIGTISINEEIALLKKIKSADVRENIHGHWIGHKEHCKNLGLKPSGLGAFKWCSRCNCGIDVREWHINDYNYCPNCGADMREDQNE